MAKPEPKLSEVLDKATAAINSPTGITLTLNAAEYMADALAKGARIIEVSETPAGYYASTWKFPYIEGGPNQVGRSGYDEVVYTSEPFPETPAETDSEIPLIIDAANMAAAMEASEPASPVTTAVTTDHDYTEALDAALTGEGIRLTAEIARLNRLLVDAMHAESAIAAALSTIRNRKQP